MNGAGASTPDKRNSKELWNRASFLTSNAVAFSKGFKTLRDMVQDVYVDPTDIKHVKHLGEGAFASVALCTVNGRLAAVKYLKPCLLASDKDVDDFMNEAALLKKLSHSAIVGFIGVAVETESTALQSSSSTRSKSRRLVEAISSRLILKPAQQSIDEDVGEKKDTLNALPISKGGIGTLSTRLKSVMLIQEYMTRGTMKSLLLKQMEHPMRLIFTRRDVLDWLIQIAQGLRYLHEANPKIIHRDLKLENIMLTMSAEGKVVAKIGDFGVHAVLKEPKHRYKPDPCDEEDFVPSFTPSESSSKGKRKAIVKASYRLSGRTGSSMYMAPEVLHCRPYNEKADVFSFAVIMYELLNKTLLLCFVSCSGEPDEVERYAQRIAGGGRPAVPDDWPKEVQSLVRLCWKQNPDDRPSTAELVQHLELLKDLDWFYSDASKSFCCAG